MSGLIPLRVAFSGGRTSAYMTWLLKTRCAGLFDLTVLFANTGREHPKTLDFVHQCDQQFGFNTVWVEAVVHPEKGEGTTHHVVTYETASRNGEPFEAVIQKYGVPNKIFQCCNRELKLRPMDSYMRSIGWPPGSLLTAIGIRADEKRRVVDDGARVIYPLVDMQPTDKQDVLDWWEDQSFDLGIPEHQGNCVGCFKKSDAKLFRTLADDPHALDWHDRMETQYGHVGPQEGRRVFFRGARSAKTVIRLYHETNLPNRKPTAAEAYEDGGCSESCELFPTA